MPKLKIKINTAFATGRLVTMNHKTSKRDLMEGKKIQQMFSENHSAEFGFEVAMRSGNGFITFGFGQASGKKGAVIALVPSPDGIGLLVKIEGTFELKLRPGVAPFLKEPGENLDLRITGATYKGGYWDGFTGYPHGVDESSIAPLDDGFDKCQSLKASDFSIK